MLTLRVVNGGDVVCDNVKCRWRKCGPVTVHGGVAIARTRLVIIPWSRGQYVLVGEDGTAAQVRVRGRTRRVTTYPASRQLRQTVIKCLESMDERRNDR